MADVTLVLSRIAAGLEAYVIVARGNGVQPGEPGVTGIQSAAAQIRAAVATMPRDELVAHAGSLLAAAETAVGRMSLTDAVAPGTLTRLARAITTAHMRLSAVTA